MGQKNPLYEYQREAFLLFQGLMHGVRELVVRKLFYYAAPDPQEIVAHFQAERQRREQLASRMHMIHQASLADAAPAESPSAGSAPGTPAAMNGAGASTKSPDDQRARLEAQRKARRKSKDR